MFPGIVAGHVARTKQAAQVWLAHNHPSGVGAFSEADIQMTDMYRDLTNGGRVQLKGMFAIAGSRYAFYDPSSSTRRSENNAIPPMARTKTNPLVERTFIRAGQLDDAPVNPIHAPTPVKTLLYGEPGIG